MNLPRVRCGKAAKFGIYGKPDFHGNPIDPNGSLVVTEWGRDLCELIRQCSGLGTTVLQRLDPSFGLQGEFLEVFASRKPP